MRSSSNTDNNHDNKNDSKNSKNDNNKYNELLGPSVVSEPFLCVASCLDTLPIRVPCGPQLNIGA